MKYSYSTNEENYEGEFDTPEEAAQACFAENPDHHVCWVGEAVRPQPENFIDGDLLIEHIMEQDEFSGDWAEAWPEATKEQKADLDERLKNMFLEWMDAHDLRPSFWNIENPKQFENPNVEE